MHSHKDLHIAELCAASLSTEIQDAYNDFIDAVTSFPESASDCKIICDGKKQVSVRDIIAYQIGWGNLLLGWYNAGLKHEMPAMPGEGFTQWNYNALAQHFYLKYAYKNVAEQCSVLHQIVLDIIACSEQEHAKGTLNKAGVWPWCSLASGKEWPLSKWIRVNTVAPYKRARMLLRRSQK